MFVELEVNRVEDDITDSSFASQNGAVVAMVNKI